MNLTTFDLLLITVILIGGIWGLIAGASRISVSFVLVLVGVTIFYSYPKISALFTGPKPWVKIFLYILVLFVSLVIFGLLMRIIRTAIASAGLGPLDKVSGLVLGLIIGALLTGTIIWGIDTYGESGWRNLLKDSKIAPSALTFFKHIMSFTEKLFPQPEVKPWWKRPLW